jgi:hypothetical protein
MGVLLRLLASICVKKNWRVRDGSSAKSFLTVNAHGDYARDASPISGLTRRAVTGFYKETLSELEYKEEVVHGGIDAESP